MYVYNCIKNVRYIILLYDGAALWNALDKKLVNAQSVADFKTMIKTWGSITCSCTWTATGVIIAFLTRRRVELTPVAKLK